MHPRSRDEYLSLCKEISDYDYHYYVLDRPLISDYEYDLKLQMLIQVEAEHPDWKVPWSPSLCLGDRPSGTFPVISHSRPMLSIANAYSIGELKEFFSRIEKSLGYFPTYSLELKVDGIAVAIRYENREFVQALSRGNGVEGEDITVNIATIRSLPKQLPSDAPDFLEVRGEVFFTFSQFQAINRLQRDKQKPEFANPRNAAGGTLKLLSSRVVASRGLKVSIYGVDVGAGSHYESLRKAMDWGFPVMGQPQRCHSVDEVIAVLDEIERKRDSLPMAIDGVVIKVDDLRDQQKLGMTAKHYRWALAYKYAPERGETVLEDIIVQVGRTGVLTPVAKLKPVFLSGSMIARASLYNEEEIERKDIRIGDTVYIEKGGEVIPKVIGVCLQKRPEGTHPWHMPEYCPVCGTKVERSQNRVSVRCTNPDCAAGLVERMRFFASENALNIEFLGDAVINKLFDLGFIQTCSDILDLKEEQLYQLPGFKTRSVEKLLNSIQKAKHTSLEQFIVALGIPFVGVGAASVLASHFKTLDNLMQAPLSELLSLDGIGEKMASSIANYFQQESNRKEIERMFSLGVSIREYKQGSSSLEGKSFVVTGTLPSLSRTDVETMIRHCGGKVGSSVSKNTNFLILGENPGSKFEKAQKLGIPILNEEEFLTLVQVKNS